MDPPVPESAESSGTAETEGPPRAPHYPRELRPVLIEGMPNLRAGARSCFEDGMRMELRFRMRVALQVAEGRSRQRGALDLFDIRLGDEAVSPELRDCLTATLQNVFDVEGIDDTLSFDGVIDEDVSLGPRGDVLVRWTDCSLVGATKLRVVLRDPIALEPHDVREVPCTDGSIEWKDLALGFWLVAVVADSVPAHGALVEVEVIAAETVSPVAVLEPIAPMAVRWETDVPGCADAAARLTFVDLVGLGATTELPCSTGSAAFPSNELGPWQVTGTLVYGSGELGTPEKRRLIRAPAGVDVLLDFTD